MEAYPAQHAMSLLNLHLADLRQRPQTRDAMCI
jgi:hypothetical protein